MTAVTVPFIDNVSPTHHISRDHTVRLRYAVFNAEDNTALEYRDDLYYLHGGYGGAFPKVEEALDSLRVGEKVDITLSPEEAYGPYRSDLVITEMDDSFPPEAHHVGAQIEGHAPDGSVIPFRVIQATPGQITVDGNHPWAGMDLRFVLEVMSVRPATEKELNDGYAHPA